MESLGDETGLTGNLVPVSSPVCSVLETETPWSRETPIFETPIGPVTVREDWKGRGHPLGGSGEVYGFPFCLGSDELGLGSGLVVARGRGGRTQHGGRPLRRRTRKGQTPIVTVKKRLPGSLDVYVWGSNQVGDEVGEVCVLSFVLVSRSVDQIGDPKEVCTNIGNYWLTVGADILIKSPPRPFTVNEESQTNSWSVSGKEKTRGGVGTGIHVLILVSWVSDVSSPTPVSHPTSPVWYMT